MKNFLLVSFTLLAINCTLSGWAADKYQQSRWDRITTYFIELHDRQLGEAYKNCDEIVELEKRNSISEALDKARKVMEFFSGRETRCDQMALWVQSHIATLLLNTSKESESKAVFEQTLKQAYELCNAMRKDPKSNPARTE